RSILLCTDVEGQHQAAAAKLAQPLHDRLRLCHRQAADHAACGAGIEPFGNCVAAANTTADLQAERLLIHDPRHDVAMPLLTAQGAIKIDDVQVIETHQAEAPRYLERIVGVA